MTRAKFYRHRTRKTLYQVIGKCRLVLDPGYVPHDEERFIVHDDTDNTFFAAVPRGETLPDGARVAILQCRKATDFEDEMVLYRGTDARLWLRSSKEFYDGRYEALDGTLQPIPKGDVQ
jgi:hypothetical protein